MPQPTDKPTLLALSTLIDKLRLCLEVVAVGEEELEAAEQAIARAQRRKAMIADVLECERQRAAETRAAMIAAAEARAAPRHWFEIVEEGSD